MDRRLFDNPIITGAFRIFNVSRSKISTGSAAYIRHQHVFRSSKQNTIYNIQLAFGRAIRLLIKLKTKFFADGFCASLKILLFRYISMQTIASSLIIHCVMLRCILFSNFVEHFISVWWGWIWSNSNYQDDCRLWN